jgi:5-hydroxyisourate hydrolase
MSGKLTTHVLDTVKGCPAQGVSIELWYINENEKDKTLIKTIKTNHDGRTDEPLLEGKNFQTGIYELVFFMGSYFSGYLDNLPNPSFLDSIPLRFGIADINYRYHVPLLASPWSYSTYRGS